MSIDDKISWIKSNGAPYIVFWLRVSRIADYFYFFFNRWTPRGDIVYLGTDCEQPSIPAWAERLVLIQERLEQANFMFLTDELTAENAALILRRDYWSIPEDDPRWDDDNCEAPLVHAGVHHCLFDY